MIKNLNTTGFSLVELIVVVAIIGVMSVGATVGFGTVGDTIIMRQTAGVIEDVVKRAELEVLRGDYETVDVHFLKDFLVIDQQLENQAEEIEVDTSAMELSFPSITGDESGQLTRKNREGETLSVDTISSGDTLAIDFLTSLDREWQYELKGDSGKSNIIRFTHFNINRESPAAITIDPAGKSLTVSAPYAKKTYSDGDSITFDLIQDNVTPETLTFNN